VAKRIVLRLKTLSLVLVAVVLRAMFLISIQSDANAQMAIIETHRGIVLSVQLLIAPCAE
jgi:hypothetical protein